MKNNDDEWLSPSEDCRKDGTHDLLEASADLSLKVMLQLATQDDMNFSLRMAEVAWDHGRRGLPFPTHQKEQQPAAAATSMLLSYLDDDHVLMRIMTEFGLTGPEAMKFGMTCRRLWSLWNHESTQLLHCQSQGALMCVMHPSLPLTQARPWWEFGQRLMAWKKVVGRFKNRTYLPVSRVTRLATALGVKSNHGNPLGPFYDLKKQWKQEVALIVGGACAFCKTTAPVTSLMWFNTTTTNETPQELMCHECHMVWTCRAFGSHQRNHRFQRLTALTNTCMLCTYCRNSIAVEEKAVLLPFGLCCMSCWNRPGHHLRLSLAEKTYSIPRKSAKEMWQGRTFHDPFEFQTGNRSDTHPPTHVLGEDAMAQAVVVHGTVEAALESSVRLMSRRRQKRALKSKRRLRFIQNLLENHELHGQDIGWKQVTSAARNSPLHNTPELITAFFMGLSVEKRRGFSFAERDHIAKYSKSLTLTLRNAKEDARIESILGKRKATSQGGRRQSTTTTTSRLMLVV